MVCCRRFGCGRARVTSRVFDPGLLLGDQALNELGPGQGANGGAPMRKGPTDAWLVSHASVSRPVSSFSTSRLTFPFDISRALCNQVAQSKCCLSSPSLSARSDPKGNSMFVLPCCTNSGLSRTGWTLPKAFVCQRTPGPGHLFAIARALPSPTMFALCSLNVKLLSFCFYRGRIGNRASEVPLRDALHDRLEQPWWHDSQGGNPRVISEQSGG